MKIGFGSYAFRWAIGTPDFIPANPLSPMALLDKAAALGAQVVQICDNMPLDALDRASLAALAEYASERGVTLELGIGHSRPDHLRRSVDVARQLGAALLRVVLDDAEWHPSLDEAASILRALLPDLRSAGVTLAIENHFARSPAELVRLVQTVDDPQVGICLDALNSIALLIGPHETAVTLAPFAVSVHVKDAAITRPGTGVAISGCPLGEGAVDLRATLEAVRAAGHSPNILIESWMDPLDDEAATLAQEEDWVRWGISTLQNLLNGT